MIFPERGRIGIFNRSYYGQVLVVRVHPELLRGEGLPDAPADEKITWRENARLIVSRIVFDVLEGLKMGYPQTSPERRRELLTIRKRLTTRQLGNN